MNKPRVVTLSIPNPFPEGRTQVYVIVSDPVTMIDTGVATDRAYRALEDGLRENGLRVSDVRRIVLTHKHIDHAGNSWRVRCESGAEILIHESEVHSIEEVDPTGARFVSFVQNRLIGWDVPAEEVTRRIASSNWKWAIESTEATGLRDGQRLPQDGGDLEIIHTPGHTMGSICVRRGSSLFSGDHVLPNISPNIGAGDMRNRGLLRHFMASLERIAELAGQDVQTYPGHGQPFVSLRERCHELMGHHRDRLDKILDVLRDRQEHTVYEVAARLFGDMDDFHLVLGCAEAAAHLEHLEHDGEVELHEGRYRLA